jgi:hypothetical protein
MEEGEGERRKKKKEKEKGGIRNTVTLPPLPVSTQLVSTALPFVVLC